MKLNDIKVVLFDLDGTIYYGDKIIDGANNVIEFFRKNDKKIFFTTNNSTKTRKQIYEKLVGMGVNCRLDEVLTSGYIAALNAKKHNMEDIYIFGSQNLIDEFTNFGIEVNQTESAKNLLIGYDPNLTYEKLTDALQVALNANYIMACNKERVFPGNNSKLMPGCGAMTAPIEWCTNRTCDFVIGKPNTLMIDILQEIVKIPVNQFLVIGDTYESDIAMADSAGAKSILISNKKFDDTIIVNNIKSVVDLFE